MVGLASRMRPEAPEAKRPRGRTPRGRSRLLARLLLDDVGGLLSLRTLDDVKFHRLTLGEGAESASLDRRVVDEDVLLARPLDEAVPLGVVEPFHHPGLTHASLSSYGAGNVRPIKTPRGPDRPRPERRPLLSIPGKRRQNTSETPPGASRTF